VAVETKTPNHQALCAKGDVYFFGHGVPKDVTAAFHFYSQAMKAGSNRALLAMAKILEDGIDTIQELD
jgi:TPR repeat protein